MGNSENIVVEDSKLESEIQKPPDIVVNEQRTRRKVYSTINPDYVTSDSDEKSEAFTSKVRLSNLFEFYKTNLRDLSI